MYHVIRRFFIFVIVCACCFILPRTGEPQFGSSYSSSLRVVPPWLVLTTAANSLGGIYDSGIGSYASYGGGYAGLGLSSSYGGGYDGRALSVYKDWGYAGSTVPASVQSSSAQDLPDWVQFQKRGGGIPSNVRTSAQPIGQSLSFGRSEPLRASSDASLGLINQQYSPYAAYQSYGQREQSAALNPVGWLIYSPSSWYTLAPGISLHGQSLASVPFQIPTMRPDTTFWGSSYGSHLGGYSSFPAF